MAQAHVQGHRSLPTRRGKAGMTRGRRRGRGAAPGRIKTADYRVLQARWENYLFKKKVLYELDKVDDLVQDFAALLRTPFTPPASHPQPSLQLARVRDGPSKSLKELSKESGLSLAMMSHLTKLMGQQEAALTLEAVAFTPPVTFLRVNTLKSSPKEILVDLSEGGVCAWPPCWSKVTILTLDDPSDPHPVIHKMITEGRCFMQRERQWRSISIPVTRSIEENPKHNIDTTNTPSEDSAHRHKMLSLFHSAYGSISSLVVMVLSAKPGENVLELCATQSGKTQHIAAMQRNYGMLLANTLSLEDVEVIMDTNKLQDVCKCIVTHIEPSRLAKRLANNFHRVLVDAPSSGIGIVRMPPGEKICSIPQELEQISLRQKLLLLNGADCVKQNALQNSYLVYTTCSVLVEENEVVVQHLLDTRPQFRLVPTGLDIGLPGFTQYRTHSFHEDMTLTRRIYSHHHHMDGAFIAKFVLESEVSAAQTTLTKKLMEKQAMYDSKLYTSKLPRDQQARVKAMKSMYKRGSLEWLKDSFIGEERRALDYSDDDIR